MPPDPKEVNERSLAVREVIKYVKGSDFPVVGLAPEGRDSEGAVLQPPPPGAGRFIAHLCRLGLRILPVGVYEEESLFCLHFGEVYSLNIDDGVSKDVLDDWVSSTVMQAISRLLPEGLRGEYCTSNLNNILR
jgi:hypothetical protein